MKTLISLLFVVLINGCIDPGDLRESGDSPPGSLVVEGVAGERAEEDGPGLDDHGHQTITIGSAEDARQVFGEEGRAEFAYPDAFRQVGIRMMAEDVSELSFRTPEEDGWSDWEPVDIYWSEGKLHNGLILTGRPVEAIELRGATSVEFAQFEFFEEVRARSVLIRGDESEPSGLPVDRAGEGDVGVRQQAAVAPASLVTSRAGWGAYQPDRICGNVVAPYRMSIHHTAVPSSDGNLYATMRGMQNYHMNNNGFCDIGYHFVVAQSGEILQGRSRANRPGAHVGNQNAGNVGISLIGNYQSTDPPQVQVESVVDIVRWVHETFNVPLNRTAVKGHREWPGQSTSCPGNQAWEKIEEILEQAGAEDVVPPPGEYGVDLEILVHDLENFYVQGSSEEVGDAFPGDRFTAEVRLTNQSEAPIQGVRLGLEIGEGLGVRSNRIESDHPSYDQQSWTRNDANDAEENPTSLGEGAELTMYAFSPGETKRVFLELEASAYNIAADHFAVRAWVANIDELYAQSGYGVTAAMNELGDALEASRRVDVLRSDAWFFRAGEVQALEGWEADGDFEALTLNVSEDLLAFKVASAGAWIRSPAWTSVDAGKFPEAVLRVRSHDGRHTKAFYWARDGEDFDEERVVRFEVPGDGELNVLLLPLGEHPEWNGEVSRIKIVVNEGLDVQEADSGWYDMDYLGFQNQAQGTSTLDPIGVVSVDPWPIEVPDREGGDDESPGMETPEGEDLTSEVTVKTNMGCSSTGGSTSSVAWMMLLGFVAIWRTGKRRGDCSDCRQS